MTQPKTREAVNLRILWFLCMVIVPFICDSASCGLTHLQLHSGRLTLGLDDANAGCRLLEVYDNRANRNIIVPTPTLWSAELKHLSGAVIRINSDECVARIISSSFDANIIWDLGSALETKMPAELKSDGDQQDRRQIKAVCKIEVDQSSARLHLNINNPSLKWSIQQVEFPHIHLAKLGPDANDDNLVTSFSAGRLTRKPLINGAQFSYWYDFVQYPSAEGPMQMYAYWDSEGGIYMSPEDPCGSFKRLYGRCAAGSDFIETKTLWYAEDSTIPGNDFDEHGSFRLQLFDGDWYDAAQIYRHWVFSEAGWKVNPEAGRPDTPQWLKDNCAWVRNIEPSVKDVVSKVIAFANFLDVPVTFHWYLWHKSPFDAENPHFFPPKEGFAEGVRKLQAAGIRVMPYICPTMWDVANADFNTVTLAATCKDANGHYYAESYNNPTKLARMCPTTNVCRDKVKEITLRLLEPEFSVDAVYLDTVASLPTVLCFDKSHGHPLGGGHWWVTNGYWPMLSQLQNAMAAHYPEAVITTESVAESYLHVFDGYLTWDWTYENQVPLYSAVYGGSIQLFGRDYRGSDQLAHCMKIGQSLVFGEQLGWSLLNFIEQKQAAAFLRDAARTRQKLLPFLSWGKMARPPKVSGNIPEVTGDWAWYSQKKWLITDSALQRGAWQSRDGRIAFIFTNVSANSFTFTWHFEPSDYGFTGRKFKIEVLNDPSSRQLFKAPIDKKIQIGSREIVTYIVQAG